MSTSTFVEALWAIKPGALQPLVQFRQSIISSPMDIGRPPFTTWGIVPGIFDGDTPALKRGKFQVPDQLMAMFKEVERPGNYVKRQPRVSAANR